MAFRSGWQASVPFKFIVEGSPVYIHRDLVSALSLPLKSLIGGTFEEAQNEEASLPGVDYATFHRFVQWAYSGYYTPAEPTKKLIEEYEAETEPNEKSAEVVMPDLESPRELDIDDTFGDLGFSSIRKPKKKGYSIHNQTAERSYNQTAERFAALQRSFSQMKFLSLEDFAFPTKPRNYDVNKEDLTDLLLSHAKLYVFAEEKDIQPLKRYVLHELHRALRIFDVTPRSARDLVPMIKHVYENTPQLSEPKEPMRLLLSKFVGSVMNKLVADKEFQSLFQNPDFTADFCSELGGHFK